MSILRTSKFVRYIGSLARNIVLNSSRNVDGLLIKRSGLFYSQNYSTAASAASHQHNENNLDYSIRRLDEDARRAGRISKRELEEVIEELKLSRSATSSQSLMVIRCCGNLVPEEAPELRTQLVNNVWQILEKLGVPMDISHYNALLRVYLENEHKFSPTEFLAELEKKGIEPNRVTYQRLIAGYCQRGDIDGATQILEFMRAKQMPISESVFNALILGHSKAGDMQSARGILGVMRQAGLEPSSDTYAALLCGYASIGDAESLAAVFEECEKDVDFTDRDYLEIVFTLAINNHDDLVDSVLKKVRRNVGYNQDASNVVLRLITHGKENIAYKIFETMPPPVRADGQVSPTGGFFVKQLVKSNRPIESILRICDLLKENGVNSRGLLIATEVALQSRNTELALDLLKAMRDNFYPIRNHYFWPLMVINGEKNGKGVLEILKKMSDFKVVPNLETIRDYVLPFVMPGSIKDVDKLVADLATCGVSSGAAAASLVGYLLNKNDIKTAADIATSYRARYTVTAPPRLVVSAFLQTGDTDSFARLMNALVQSRDRRQEEEVEEYTSFDDREFIGRMLLSVIGKKGSFNLTDLLQKMVEFGLGISNSTAEQIQSQLSGSELTSEVSTLLSQLVSGDLTRARLETQRSRFVPRNEESLRRFIENLKAKGDPAINIKRQLFSLLCASRDVDKVLEYCKELEAEGFVFTTGMRALLIELYVQNNNLEAALNEYETLLKNEPDLKLDNMKAIKLATGLIQAERLSDALEFLKKQAREEGDIQKEKEKERPFIYSSACWRLLNVLSEKGDTEGVRKVFDSLVENKFIEPNNAFLGPLVKAHLVKDDLKGALEVYEWCCQHYRATPFKNELACRLIQKEDATELQRLTDLSTIVHGEINSLHDLIIAFVECGRIRQARKILETPGLRVRSDKLSYAGERYQSEGLVEPLEGLIKATKDISQVDRSSLYYQLLLSYMKADDVEKAVGLWTQMQEEDVQPSDEFLRELGLFLKDKNETVPFVIPDAVVKENKVPDSAPSADFHRNLQKGLSNKNWAEALKAYQALQKSNAKLYPTEVTGFLELALDSVGAIEALNFVKDWLSNKVLIPRYKLYYFTKMLAKTGDVKTYEDYGNYLDDDQKLQAKYNNLICNCYIAAGKTEELLNIWETKVKGISTPKELEVISQNIPGGGFLAVMEADASYLPRLEAIAELCAVHGFISLINTIWMHYLTENNFAKADEIFNKHLKSSPRLMFRYLLGEARKKGDESKVDKLLEYLKNWNNVSNTFLGIAYSAKVDILAYKDDTDKALACVEDALKEISLVDMNYTTLNRLKKSCIAKNKEFPYDISNLRRRRRRVDNESSDSDVEEVSRKTAS